MTALVVQLFLTTFVMRRFGLTVALLVTPAVMIFGSLGFLAVPILWTGSLLNTADSGFAYSINQSAREALYTPTTRDEKYKAKAFIDMFVQRFAKALAVGVSLTITLVFADFSTIRWLSLLPSCSWRSGPSPRATPAATSMPPSSAWRPKRRPRWGNIARYAATMYSRPDSTVGSSRFTSGMAGSSTLRLLLRAMIRMTARAYFDRFC